MTEDPRVAADLVVERAESATVLGRPEEGLRLVAPVIAADPTHLTAHLVASRAALLLRDAATARAHAVAAVRLAPQDARAHVAVSMACTLAGRRDVAVRAAEEAVRLDPSDRQAHVALAAAGLGERGSTARTRSAARAALAIEPDSPAMHVLVARAHMYDGRVVLRRRQRRVADHHLRRALALDPASVEALAEVGVLEAMRWRLGASVRGHVGVLAGAPGSRTAAHGVSFVVVRLALVLQGLACLAWVALLVVRATGGRWTAAGAAVSVLALVVLAVVVVRTLGGLGRSAPSVLRRWARGHRRHALWLLVVVGVVVAVAVAGLVPDPGVADRVLAGAGAGLLLGLGLGFVGSGTPPRR